MVGVSIVAVVAKLQDRTNNYSTMKLEKVKSSLIFMVRGIENKTEN